MWFIFIDMPSTYQPQRSCILSARPPVVAVCPSKFLHVAKGGNLHPWQRQKFRRTCSYNRWSCRQSTRSSAIEYHGWSVDGMPIKIDHNLSLNANVVNGTRGFCSVIWPNNSQQLIQTINNAVPGEIITIEFKLWPILTWIGVPENDRIWSFECN